ncbi:hypothetical protein [Phenylobacterium soli]|uniref:HTH iclR-type domain-containing protein n=1 Tax=Phenylobacterium soli TaxID=2170551 RepID=A0A328APJ5_9CAUL|nr:hypothetical protein [Phenylobacterium soli]RAK54768.1 hypothetical protein DJ017_09645 [Phenylobacterium soli]
MTAAQPSFDTVSLVTLLTIPCILDASMVGREDRDFMDALILLAVVQANVAPLIRDRDLQRAYGGADEPPPDELRRPVSINAIAHSLRLPYETTRRRIMRLAREGACDIGESGVIVPTRELASPRHVMALMAIWQQIHALYLRLRDLGLMDEMIAPADRVRWDAAAGEPPVRAVIRIASDFMLRLIDNTTAQFGGLVAGVIWFAILRANTEHLSTESRPGLADDGRRRPVRIAEIAGRLSAPQETVRRYAAELAAQDLCERGAKGFVVPAEVLARPESMKILTENFSDLQRMFSGFAQLGVLAEWDRQSPPLQGVA